MQGMSDKFLGPWLGFSFWSSSQTKYIIKRYRSLEIIFFNIPNQALIICIFYNLSSLCAFVFNTRIHMYDVWNLPFFTHVLLVAVIDIYIINLGCRGWEIYVHVIYAGIAGRIWSLASCYERVFNIQLCKGMKVWCMINDILNMY